jgi:hypothetical protein
MDPDDKDIIALNVWYHFATELAVLILAFAYAGVVEAGGRRAAETSAWPYYAVCLSIGISAIVTISDLRSNRGVGVFPRDFTPKVDRFPFVTLAWDFANLAALTALTGGIHSVFLPLFVIGLVLGDVAIDGQRLRLWSTFITSLVIGTVLPLEPSVRCIYLNVGGEPCAESLWDLRAGWDVLAALLIFVPGALFGSLVLRWALGPSKSANPGDPG